MKKGISAIVATVLIILITIAAVTILWATVIPIIRDNLELETLCLNAQIVIDDASGYTCFDSVSKAVSVKVSKGTSDVEGVQFIFSSGGDSRKLTRSFDEEVNVGGTFYFVVDGDLDEVSVAPVVNNGRTERVCESVASVDNLKECDINYVDSDIEEDIVAYWKFDDDLNEVDERLHGNFIEGAIGGGATYEAGRNGIGRSIRLDYLDNESVYIFNAQPLNITKDFSISGWVRPYKDNHSFVFWSGSCPTCGYYVYVMPTYAVGTSLTQLAFFTRDYDLNAWRFIYSDITLGEWVHFTGVFKSSEYMKLYLNGELADERTDVGSRVNVSSDTFVIGRRGWWSPPESNEWFDGNIDEIMVLDRAMDEDEVKELYEFQR